MGWVARLECTFHNEAYLAMDFSLAWSIEHPILRAKLTRIRMLIDQLPFYVRHALETETKYILKDNQSQNFSHIV